MKNYKLIMIILSVVAIGGMTIAVAENSMPNKNTNTSNSTGQTNMALKNTYTGFKAPTDIAQDKQGNLYVSNWSSGNVTKITKDGTQSIISEGMGSPSGLAFDQQDNLYIADYSRNVIYRLTNSGERSVFASGLKTPAGISFSRSGALLVTNRASNEIASIDPQGKVTIIASGLRTPVGVVEDKQGNLFVTNYGGGVYRVSNGKTELFSTGFSRPGVGIVITDKNEMYAIDNGAGNVKRLHSDGSTVTAINNIGGAVALLAQGENLYVSGWNNGAVYHYVME